MKIIIVVILLLVLFGGVATYLGIRKKMKQNEQKARQQIDKMKQ